LTYITPVVVLSFTCALLLVCLGISVYLNVKMGMTILKIEDVIEDSLDTLDARYQSISKVLETPIFFDSIEVRQVVEDMRLSRDTILIVANSLSSVQEKSEDE